MSPTRPIRFFHRGAIVEVEGVAPTRTVLEWLREDARCTGTKEGCNEGDCGACTVVVGELPVDGAAVTPDLVRGLRLRTVNACIQFLPTLDGKALFTVEDLARPQTSPSPGRPKAGCAPLGSSAAAQVASHQRAPELHPAQQAMVDRHGSQCGFCTPGFVMSLFATYEHHGAAGTRPSRQQLADDLSGNLCRCTGYRPILDAGERMFDATPAPLDTAPAIEALLGLLPDGDSFAYEAGDETFLAPRTLEALAAARLAQPQARLLAGSTDVGLWVTKQFRPLPALIYIGEVGAMKRIESNGSTLTIGAAASLEDAYRALAGRWPALTDVWLRFASVPIRNAGTLGGNVANGSPIGDSAPVLMALDARLVLRRGDHTRRMPLEEFYTGYMTNHLAPGEFLEAVEVPLENEAQLRVYKISKRFDCDISAVCAALAIELDESGAVRTARFAFGGMAATVKRAAGAEAALVGREWSEAAVASAQAALALDYTPLTDMRASAAYRLQVAQNLLRRFWLETRLARPLAATEVSVFATMHPEAAS